MKAACQGSARGFQSRPRPWAVLPFLTPPLLRLALGIVLGLIGPRSVPAAAPAPSATPTPPTVRSAAAARALGAAGEFPAAATAEIEGVVILAEPRWSTWFIHDGSTSIAFTGSAIPSQLAPGQRVRIEGTVHPGRFAPVIHVTRLVPLGQAPIPAPRAPDPGRLGVGGEDGQWIEVQGVVRHASEASGYTTWNLVSELGTFEAIFLAPPSAAAAGAGDWIGSVVRLQGVCLTDVHANGQFSRFRIAINSVADVRRILPSPADPFAAPLRPIARVLAFSPTARSGQVVRVRGTVTWSSPGFPFQIQDDQAGLAVTPQPGEAAPPAGTVVDVVGFPTPGDDASILEFARIRTLGVTNLPASRLVDLTRPDPAADGLRVTVEGDFLDLVPRAGIAELGLRDNVGGAVQVLIAESVPIASLPGLEHGCRIRLTGVYRIRSDPGRKPTGHRLMVSSADDITVLARGSWWNTRRTTTAVALLLLATAGGVAWTLTLRGRSADALRPSEERFRELAEQGEDILWVFDLRKRSLVYLAPSFTRLTGVDADSCLTNPRRALHLMDRHDRSRWLRTFAECVHAPGNRFAIEYRIRGPAAPPRWILDQGVVIRDPTGRPIRISGVARDITARKEAELALATERARFRDLFENSPDAVFVESSEGVILDVNRAACGLHRMPRERLLGRHVTELVPESIRNQVRNRFQRLASGEINVAESASLRSDGTSVPVELQASRITHEGRDALLLHIRDISARKEADLFLAGQKRILEWIATARPLPDVLAELARVTEARAPGALCWTHCPDSPDHPPLIAPSIRPAAAVALGRLLQREGLPGARFAGSGGHPVIIHDPFREGPAPAGPTPDADVAADANAAAGANAGAGTGGADQGCPDLIAIPILSASGASLGTFGALLPPGPADLDLLRLAASLARVAIERHRADTALREGSERLRTANSALLALARSDAISRGDLGAALGEITETAARTVGVGHVSVWLLDESAGLLRRLHEFSSTDVTPAGPAEHRVRDLPLYLDALSRERLVSTADAPADPRFAELFAHHPTVGHTARLDAGFRLRGRIAGMMVLGHGGQPRHWKVEEELIAGSLADIVAMALQASERRCIEEALRQSEEAYRSVVSALAEGVMLVNRDGAFLAYNESATEILGLSTQDLTGRRLDDASWKFIRQDGSPIPPAEFPATITLRTGQPITDAVVGVHHPDNSIVWISINTRPFARDDDGRIESVIVSFTDITRRQEAEHALHEGHELVRAISDVQASFIADTDPSRSVERMLATLVHMTRSSGGIVAEVVDGPDASPRLRRFAPAGGTHSDPDITPDDLLEQVRTSGLPMMRSLPQDPERPDVPGRHLLAIPLRHDTEVIGVVELARFSPPFSPDTAARLEPLLITCANLIRAIHSDRQRQEAEARIRQLNAELEQRVEQRTADLNAINQELAEFAYVVTHDLKAPLRGIHQLSEWLAQDHASGLDPAGLKLLALMRQRVLHLQRLIDGLLACARVGRSPEPVGRIATRELIRQVVAVIAPPPHVTFQIADDLPVIEGNPDRLHQIFQNLLDNAVKYLDKPRGYIQVTARRDPDAWQFTVADNGPGIPRRYREKVFQIFQRLHQSSDIPGTGLGLTLVKRIVESRGGRIWIDSEPDTGTSIRFTWPDHARERAVG